MHRLIYDAMSITNSSLWYGIPWLILCVASCSPGRDSQNAPSSANDEMAVLLTTALRTQLNDAPTPIQMDTTKIVWRTQASAVTPGLVYRWASYRAMETSHGFVFAVAARRNSGPVIVIRNPQDWSTATNGWQPTTADEAISACAELARAVGPGRNPERLSVPLGDAEGEISAMPEQLQARVRPVLSDTVTTLPPSPQQPFWTVEFWMFETGLTARYRCSLGSTVQLVVLNQIAGVGWFPVRAASRDSG